eukprot:11795320-Alexandrium_andersonii.AAC.1
MQAAPECLSGGATAPPEPPTGASSASGPTAGAPTPPDPSDCCLLRAGSASRGGVVRGAGAPQ